MNKFYSLFTFFLFLLSTISNAQKAGQECFPVQQKDQLVYDDAGILSAEERQTLENRLQLFAVNSSNEIFVVIVPDLCGMDKAQFAVELGEKWGAGQKTEDNGVVILVKPKTPESSGQTFIATGRGLEGAIPDATTHLIVENEMIPSFKNGNMFEGIDKATATIVSLASGEYNSDAYAAKYKSKGKNSGSFFVMALLIVAFFLLIKRNQVNKYAKLNNISFWAAWALLISINRSHGGSFSDFTGGRGHFGGWSGGGGSSGGGGGFSGFGAGGSFGGGGSGGSW